MHWLSTRGLIPIAGHDFKIQEATATAGEGIAWIVLNSRCFTAFAAICNARLWTKASGCAFMCLMGRSGIYFSAFVGASRERAVCGAQLIPLRSRRALARRPIPKASTPITLRG